MSTRTAVVTGATSGLGEACARSIAATPGWRVVLAVRDTARGGALADELGAGTRVVELDLASLASVARAARELAAGAPVDALVLNAGLQTVKADRRTAEGIELTFGVNHLGHFALATRLLGAGALAPGARVLAVSSGTHFGTFRKAYGYPAPRWRDPRALARADGSSGQVAYATSKLANVLFAYELARRLPDGMTANAYDPGLMPATGLARRFPAPARAAYRALTPLLVLLPGATTPERSGAQLARWATDPARAGTTGAYLELGRPVRSAPLTYDEDVAAELWRTSSELSASS